VVLRKKSRGLYHEALKKGGGLNSFLRKEKKERGILAIFLSGVYGSAKIKK